MHMCQFKLMNKYQHLLNQFELLSLGHHAPSTIKNASFDTNFCFFKSSSGCLLDNDIVYLSEMFECSVLQA